MLKVTLLGTGGTQPLPDRALAAAAVTVGGRSVLLDCGEGTQVGLRRYGVSAYRLSAVLLTHYHGDHILGLPGLLQTLGSLNRTEPLMIYGPKGIEPVAQAVTALAGPQAYPVRWQVADGPFHIDTLKITPFPLNHRVPCCGYVLALPRAGRFDPARARAAGIPMPYWKTLQRGAPRRGLKVVYATDTRPCAALEAAARDADLLCMDATYAELAVALESELETRELMAQVMALPPPDGELFLRRYVYGETAAQLGVHFNMPAATVRTRLHRARLALQKLLKEG